MQSSNVSAAEQGAASTQNAEETPTLKQGDRVGNRFVVEKRLRDDIVGATYRAIDEQSGKHIALLVFSSALVRDRALTRDLRVAFKLAKPLNHKNILRVYGMGREGGSRYLAGEHIGARSLATLLERKARAGKSFTLKGTYNLMAHICNALQHALPTMVHGTLRPSSVLVTREGRVKLAGFGMAALRPAIVAHRPMLRRWDRACLPSYGDLPPDAPVGGRAEESGQGREIDAVEAAVHVDADSESAQVEALEPSYADVASTEAESDLNGLERSADDAASFDTGMFATGATAADVEPLTGDAEAPPQYAGHAGSARDDLHALGVLLYSLLVGKPPHTESPVLPDDVAERLPSDIGEVMRRCFACETEARFREPAEVKAALLEVVQQSSQKRSSGAQHRSGRPPSEAQPQVEPTATAPNIVPTESAPAIPAARTAPSIPLALADPSASGDSDSLPGGAREISDLSQSAPFEAEIEPMPAELEPQRSHKPRLSSLTEPGNAPPPLPGETSADAVPLLDQAPDRRGRSGSTSFEIPELGSDRPEGEEVDDTALRWLLQKEGIDLGPFTKTQVVEKLFAEEISPQTLAFDIETSRRLPLSEFTAFETAVVSWVHEKADRERKRAENAAEASYRRRSRVLAVVAVLLVLGLAGGGGGYAWFQATRPTPVKAHLGRLVAAMNHELPRVALPDEVDERVGSNGASRGKAARRAGRSRKRGRSREDKAWREAQMASQSAVDLGAGGKPFDNQAVYAAVSSRSRKLMKCLEAEARRNPSLKSIEVKVTVVPKGNLINIRLPQGSKPGAACVRKALSGLKTPAFAGTNRTVSFPYTIGK